MVQIDQPFLCPADKANQPGRLLVGLYDPIDGRSGIQRIQSGSFFQYADQCVNQFTLFARRQFNIDSLAVGPTDVAWENWAEKHKAPAELFK